MMLATELVDLHVEIARNGKPRDDQNASSRFACEDMVCNNQE